MVSFLSWVSYEYAIDNSSISRHYLVLNNTFQNKTNNFSEKINLFLLNSSIA